MANEHELKFVIDNQLAPKLIRWLDLRCYQDPNYYEGVVSSIYFDFHDLTYLREKINSDFLKTKIRIRWYAALDSKSIIGDSFVEAKFKYGSKRKKIRGKTNISGSWLQKVELQDPKLLSIPSLLREHGVAVGGGLLPVMQISYKRKRFVEPTTGARLCVDFDISAPKVNFSILPRYNAIALESAVFEMKGNLTGLPDVLHQITAFGCKKTSFSKYSACYYKVMRMWCNG
jgi:hypothetical protein